MGLTVRFLLLRGPYHMVHIIRAVKIILFIKPTERDPIKQFKSTWKYYNAMLKGFRQKLPSYDEDSPDFIAEITDFLQRPNSYVSGLR